MQISRRSLLLSVAVPARSQDTKFSSEVRVVSLLATVRDKNGAIVKDLAKDDFLLEEDGRPQVIHYFSQESDLPLAIGLLVDTSRSQIHVLEGERKASYTFLDLVLREDRDLALIASFDFRVELLEGFTSSRKELAAALAGLYIPKPGTTLLYDAVGQASASLMKSQKERKTLIILSDGVDYMSRISIETAIEFAQRADAVIYGILFGDPVTGWPHSRGGKAMQRMALETGGECSVVSKADPIDRVFNRIQEELRSQYSLGYTPDRIDTGRQFRRIRLRAKRSDWHVQTRAGYYPK